MCNIFQHDYASANAEEGPVVCGGLERLEGEWSHAMGDAMGVLMDSFG